MIQLTVEQFVFVILVSFAGGLIAGVSVVGAMWYGRSDAFARHRQRVARLLVR